MFDSPQTGFADTSVLLQNALHLARKHPSSLARAPAPLDPALRIALGPGIGEKMANGSHQRLWRFLCCAPSSIAAWCEAVSAELPVTVSAPLYSNKRC